MPDDEFVRICQLCKHENPADADTCYKCYVDLFQVPPPRKRSEAEKEPSPDSEESFSGSNTSARICKECNAELDIEKHLPGCKRASTGYELAWKDAQLKPLQLTKAKSVFIGRVHPVDTEMLVYLEERHKTVSRNHAELFVGDDGNPYLRDMDSLNGSFVNGRKAVPFVPTILNAGDEVSFSKSLSATIK